MPVLCPGNGSFGTRHQSHVFNHVQQHLQRRLPRLRGALRPQSTLRIRQHCVSASLVRMGLCQAHRLPTATLRIAMRATSMQRKCDARQQRERLAWVRCFHCSLARQHSRCDSHHALCSVRSCCRIVVRHRLPWGRGSAPFGGRNIRVSHRTAAAHSVCRVAVWLTRWLRLAGARGGGGRPGARMNTVFIQPRAREKKTPRQRQPLNGGGALAMLGRGLVAAMCDSPRREGWRGASGRVYEYSIHTASGARDKSCRVRESPRATNERRWCTCYSTSPYGCKVRVFVLRDILVLRCVFARQAPVRMTPSEVTFAIKNALIERRREQYEYLRMCAQDALALCETEKELRSLKSQIRRLTKVTHARASPPLWTPSSSPP